MALIAAGVGQKNNGVLIQPCDGEVGVEKDLEMFSCYGHQGLILNKVVVWVFSPHQLHPLFRLDWEGCLYILRD